MAGCVKYGAGTGTFAETGRYLLLSIAIPVVQIGVRKMSAGQSSGTGATTEFDDEKVRKNDILSNRDKAQKMARPKLGTAKVSR